MTTQPGANKRVLMVLSSAAPVMGDGKKSGYYWSETYHPFEVFTKAGYTVDFVSETGTASVDEHSVATAEQLMAFEVSALSAWHDKSGPLHAAIAKLRSPAQVNPSDYGIVFFPGGHACSWDLPSATSVQKLAATIYEQGGVVAAVCHGPAVLGGLKLSSGEYLVKGKKANGFSVEEEDKVGVRTFLTQHGIPMVSDLISKAGGLYEKGPAMKEYTVNDGRLVTGQNPASAQATAQRALDVREGRVQ